MFGRVVNCLGGELPTPITGHLSCGKFRSLDGSLRALLVKGLSGWSGWAMRPIHSPFVLGECKKRPSTKRSELESPLPALSQMLRMYGNAVSLRQTVAG